MLQPETNGYSPSPPRVGVCSFSTQLGSSVALTHRAPPAGSTKPLPISPCASVPSSLGWLRLYWGCGKLQEIKTQKKISVHFHSEQDFPRPCGRSTAAAPINVGRSTAPKRTFPLSG